MKYFVIYLIGVAVALIGAFLHELYLYGFEIRKISFREVVEDFVISLFSWIAAFIELAMAVMSWAFSLDNYNLWPLGEKFNTKR